MTGITSQQSEIVPLSCIYVTSIGEDSLMENLPAEQAAKANVVNFIMVTLGIVASVANFQVRFLSTQSRIPLSEMARCGHGIVYIYIYT